MSGQSIHDRITAAKHSISGQGLAKSVCKATTEEVLGPKKKHIDCEFSNLNFAAVHIGRLIWTAVLSKIFTCSYCTRIDYLKYVCRPYSMYTRTKCLDSTTCKPDLGEDPK